MVAEFPIFSKVTVENKPFFDEFNAQFPPYADWAFGTLMTWWDAFDDLEVSQLSGNLVIKSSYLSMGEVPQFILLGTHNIDESLTTIFTYQKAHQLPRELYSLPQYTIDALEHPENYIVVDDPNATEYIISTKKSTRLAGNEMYRLRRAVIAFEKDMHEHAIEVTDIPLTTFPAKMMLINALHTWQRGIYRNDNELLEGAMIDRAFLMAENIDMQCLCLFIDKQIEGFILYKPLSNTFADVCHIKVSYNYPNMFRYFTHLMNCELRDKGFEYLNWEQDLGIEGLRAYKHSLRPVDTFHKYNLYPRP